MAFIGTGKQTYIYLDGIRPLEKLCLGQGVWFIPAECKPKPEEIVSKCHSEMDIGIACIFLRNVSSCFKIEAANPKELAAKAWNAQWNAILLSAFFDCEVGCNFQSDVLPNDFAKAEEFNITNYALKGSRLGNIKKLTAANHKWLSLNYLAATRLLENAKYSDAVHCLYSYRWHSMPRAQLALLWSGIEGFFGVDFELSFRLSLYVAKYLYPKNRSKQKVIFDEIKDLYKIRSKAVHGGHLKNAELAVQRSREVLWKLVTRATEDEDLPRIENLTL